MIEIIIIDISLALLFGAFVAALIIVRMNK